MTSDSIAKLAPALLKAQRKMGAALKDSKNPFYKSQYADLGSVIDAAVPTLNDEGISVLQFINSSSAGSPELTTILLHESGEYILGNAPIITKQANDPQAFGSAVTYTRRYSLSAAVSQKAEDDDGERAMERPKATQSTLAKDRRSEQSSTSTKPTTQSSTPAPSASPAVLPEAVLAKPSESTKPFTDTKILRAKIKSAFAVLEAQKKVTKTEFVTNYLAGGKVDTISNDQVLKTTELLKTKFPELGFS